MIKRGKNFSSECPCKMIMMPQFSVFLFSFRGDLMKGELQKLAELKPISNDLFEVVSRGLK